MTKKDYILLANALRLARNNLPKERAAVDYTVEVIADYLGLDNPRFDAQRFITAIHGEDN